MFRCSSSIVVIQLWYNPTRRGRVMAGRAGSGAGMVEGSRWHKWVFFHVPLMVFRRGHALSVLLDARHRVPTRRRSSNRPWRAVNNTPFWTTQPTLEHAIYLFKQTMFATWLWNTMFIALLSTLISLFCGLLAGYAAGAAPLSAGRRPRDQHLRDLSGANRRSSSSRWPTSSVTSGSATRRGR